ncbi:MAG: hypothetical protein P8M06_05360 [Pelagibacterales bacterium]|nr:hypothetical protein [Pelagibacterales bacterium]
MNKYIIIIFSILFLFTLEASAKSGRCKSEYIYEPGVYFFATKADNYAGGSKDLRKWHYSGRKGTLEDCKKFWRTRGDSRSEGGFIRSWESKMIVSKEEYCSAKLFHSWFGFGSGGLKYCKDTGEINLSPKNDYTNQKNNNPMYIYAKDVNYLCRAIDVDCSYNERGRTFKQHMIEFLSGEHSSALAFSEDGGFDQPGYQFAYDYSSIKNAQRAAINGCEEFGKCTIVIEDNIIVDSRLKEKLIQAGFSGSVKRTKNNDESKKAESESDSEETSSSIEVQSKLKSLKKILDEGLISQEQYDEKSSKILDDF